MYCKKCGSKIRDNAKFCPKCGAVLKSSYASVDSNSVNDTTDKIASSIKKDTANGKRIIVLGIGAVAAIVVIGIIVFAIKRPSTEDIKGTEIASESTSEGIDSAENTSDSKNDMDSSEELADAPQTEGTVQMWMGTDPANQTDNEAIENSSYKDLMCDAIDDAINQYWESNQLDDWKDKEEYTENTQFYLLYIDNDDKPEILITPASGMIDGSSILYIKDAVVESYFIGSSDSITYIPNSGVICIYHGLHMPTTEEVMSFPDQTVLGEGEFCDAGWYGEKANPVDGSDTIYIWNGETLSEEEYLSQKEAVFSGDIHEAWNEDAYTYEEVTTFLDGFDNE